MTHEFQNHLNHGLVSLFSVGPDEIGLSNLARLNNTPNRRIVVVDVNPITHIETGSIQSRLSPIKYIRDLPRYELLDMLSRPIIIGAIADGGLDSKTANPCPHEVVTCGFGG